MVKRARILKLHNQFVIFKLLNYCFEEILGFYVKASFARRPVSRLIKPSDTTEFQENAIQLHGAFHGLKITNSNVLST